MTAIMPIVEDEEEAAIMLQIYQQAEQQDRPATDILKRNDIVIIKEPRSGSWVWGIRTLCRPCEGYNMGQRTRRESPFSMESPKEQLRQGI